MQVVLASYGGAGYDVGVTSPGAYAPHRSRKSIVKTILGGALAASLLTLGLPMAASSQTADPVIINNVSTTKGHPVLGQPTIVSVSFENTSDVPATSVEFRLTDADGNQTDVNDSGTFSKGAEIQQEYRIDRFGNDASASIVGVEFADGSSWGTAPAAPTPRRQASENSTPADAAPAESQAAIQPPATPIGAYAL